MKIDDLFDNPNPNAIGEWLRAYTFDCKNGEYGCYSCFEVKPSFKPLVDDELIEKCVQSMIELYNRPYKRKPNALALGVCQFEDENDEEEIMDVIDHGGFYREKELVVSWYWEGDGTLLFFDCITGNGVVNDDCKKDHYWKEIKI